MGCSPPGSSVHGISQARILEWGVISFSRGSFWPRLWTPVSCITGEFFSDWATTEALLDPGVCMLCHFSHVQLFATLFTVACQSPLSMGFFRQEYRSGLPCPPLGDLPKAEIGSVSFMSPALAGGVFTDRAPWQVFYEKFVEWNHHSPSRANHWFVCDWPQTNIIIDWRLHEVISKRL